MTHSRKILAQAGTSLADIYDVEGSVVGLESLDVGEVKAVHELGGTIMSERLTAFVQHTDGGALAQNLQFNFQGNDYHDQVTRILGVTLLTDFAARVRNACVSIQDLTNGREMPLFVWDTADDPEPRVRWSIDGAAVGAFFHLRSLFNQFPSLVLRTGTERITTRLVCRGVNDAFGAGDVTVHMLVYIAFPSHVAETPGEPSSHGLPLPSW